VTSATRVKHEIRDRYDDLGTRVGRDLGTVSTAAELWRLVEGRRPALRYFRARKITTALELGRFPTGASLAEIGCGTGDYSLLLARMGFRVTGVDLSPKSIEAAREKAARAGMASVSFVVSDAESLAEIPGDAVDGVVSFSALRYVPNLEAALAAIRRIVRPEGTVVLDFPNRYCPWFRLLKNRFGVETHIHDHHYSSREIAHRLTDAGFRAIEIRRILYTSYVVPTLLLPLFRWIDRIGEATPFLNQTAGVIMATAVKPR
jgi:SAM-dependent methyltransferase